MTKGVREYEHNQEGAKMRGVKFLDKEKHTSRGSKLMNLVDCIRYVHIHVLDCILHKPLKFNMHTCVVYASYRI
jgi:hypothetical protein